MWDLSGIPCRHAVSCIYVHREKPEDYIYPYFSKDTYMLAYISIIHSVPGQYDWVDTGLPTMAPPFYRRQARRPKKLRRRDVDEPFNPYRVSRKHKYIVCAKCLQRGHSKSSCKGLMHPESKINKKTKSGSTLGQGQSQLTTSVSASVPTQTEHSSEKVSRKKHNASSTSKGGSLPHQRSRKGSNSMCTSSFVLVARKKTSSSQPPLNIPFQTPHPKRLVVGSSKPPATSYSQPMKLACVGGEGIGMATCKFMSASTLGGSFVARGSTSRGIKGT